jgi:hypothetical protein
MRRTIGDAWYELPERSSAQPPRVCDLLNAILGLTQLEAEARMKTPQSKFERRPCRGCGVLRELRYLEVIATPSGWKLLCTDCQLA